MQRNDAAPLYKIWGLSFDKISLLSSSDIGMGRVLPRASTLFIIEKIIHFKNPMHSKYMPISNKDDFTEMIALNRHQIFNSLRRVFASAILID